MKNFKVSRLLMLLMVVVMVVSGCGNSTTSDNYDEADNYTAHADKDGEETADDAGSNEEADSTQTAGNESEDSTDTTDGETEVAPTPVVVEEFFDTEYPFVFLDKFGNEIIIESKPETAVSFSPELTETIFAIGAGDVLVGRSSWCDYPAEAAEVPDMGSLFDFNLEQLIAAEPDVVFLSSMVSEEVYNQIVENGMIPILLDYDENLSGTLNYIRLVGQILDAQEGAVGIINNMRQVIAEVTDRAKDREPVSMYYVVAAGEYTSTATGDTWLHDVIITTGATNAAEDGTFWMYTVEQLIEKDPDYILCSQNWDMKATIESLEGYKDLTAVKEGRLVEVDENIFSRQGPRVIDALLLIEEVLYGSN